MRRPLSIAFAAGYLFICVSLAGAQDLERLRLLVTSGDTELQRSAIVQVRNLRTAEASRLVAPLLNDKNEIVRASAAGAVVYLPGGEAASLLLPLLSDNAVFVRQETAYALGDVGDPSAVSPLLTAVQKGPDPVRNAAVVALGKIGEPLAINTLLAVFKKKPNDDNEFLRRSAARSIGQIAQFQATGNRDLRTPQNYLPTRFKDPGPAISPPDKYPTVAPVLIRILQNSKESDDTRREAAFALGWTGNPLAIPGLRQYLASPDNHLAEIAKEALIRLHAFQ